MSTISAEQWLQSHGWRDTIVKLGSAKSDVFLDGYRAFRARLEHERRSEVIAFSSVAALAALCAGVVLGATFF